MTLKTAQLELLTADEVAALLKVHRKTIYKWVETGKLKAEKLMGRWMRIRPEAVKRFQDEWMTPANAG